MSKISKRKYPAYFVAGTNKWFTGYDGEAITREYADHYAEKHPDRTHPLTWGGYVECTEGVHEYRHLSLQFLRTAKGRSSAVAIFKDEAGFEYKLSFLTLDKILNILHHPVGTGLYNLYDVREKRDLTGGGTWIEGTFMQIKQGANYFIEPVEVAKIGK